MVFRSSLQGYPIQQLRDEVDRLVTNVFNSPAVAGATRLVSGRGFPSVNIWESSDNVFVEAEVPGLKPENLDVSVVGNELTIKGERPNDQENEGSFHRRERGVGSFTRVVRLTSEVDASRVEAQLNNGVLLLTLPKSETAKPRKIQVKTQ